MVQQNAAQIALLNGWKEIANYLGKGVRTVQRYERDLGLPIRRPAGKFNGSVVATKSELDAWIAASPLRAVFRLQRPHDTVAALNEFRVHLQEARRLRLESSELRASLHEALELLKRTIQITIPAKSRGELQERDSTLDATEHRFLGELLTFDSRKKWKVN
jgi:hypothetical protein